MRSDLQLHFLIGLLRRRGGKDNQFQDIQKLNVLSQAIVCEHSLYLIPTDRLQQIQTDQAGAGKAKPKTQNGW